MTLDEIITHLEAQSDPNAVAGMGRYGIVGAQVYGVKVPILREMAKQAGRDHALAAQLWDHNSRETRIMATLVDHPKWVDEAQMERWVAGLDSWEVCDQACSNLFAATPFAYEKAMAWSARPEEFIKRAGFVLMAQLAHKTSKLPDDALLAFLPLIEREAADGRNFVKKAVNWALRDIGKRNAALNAAALDVAARLRERPEAAARWNGSDAYRELSSDSIRERLSRSPSARLRPRAPETPSRDGPEMPS